MKKTLFLALIFLCLGFAHPFYLSVTDLKYNAKEKKIQGSVKIFTNDLERTLKKIAGKPVDLINVKDTSATNKIVETYLKSHLSFDVNAQKINYSMLGFEREQDAVYIYIESEMCKKPLKVTITNSILYEQLKEQSNIVHLEVAGERKSLKVTNPQKEVVLTFK